MKLMCSFGFRDGYAIDTGWRPRFSSYICVVCHDNIITEPSQVVKEINGVHEESKSNEDVQTIEFIDCVIYFIPQGLGVFFRNVTRLEIIKCDLKTLSREDLDNFTNLEMLHVDENKLTILPDDLFQGTPKVISISFDDNFIRTMCTELFKPIIGNPFTRISFIGNIKIDSFYTTEDTKDSRAVASIAELMKIIDSECSIPSSNV